MFVCEKCIWPSWGQERYATIEECFEDRVTDVNRVVWFNLISAWNTPDKTRTAKTMFDEGHDIYVGMRARDEYEACMAAELFDHVIWVDASDRLPPEQGGSMELTKEDADIFIDNNGPEELLPGKVEGLRQFLAEQGYDVGVTSQDQAPELVKQSNNKLIVEPTVFAMGQTQFNVLEMQDWIEHNNLEDAAYHYDTPLARLWANVSDDDALARMAEFGGRHCYRAWEKGRDRQTYIDNIIEMNHGSVLEHGSINWAIQGVSRSLSLELARHRVGIALSQESQRYVDAADINFVLPPIMRYLAGHNAVIIEDFRRDCILALDKYKRLQEAIVSQVDYKVSTGALKADTMAKKRANEAARAHLPNATETRFLWTTNMRILMHFLWLRGGSGADLEIRRLAVALLKKAQVAAPEIFNRMTTKEVPDGYGVPIIVAAD